ncbi:MAG TPA: hypothetical protein VGQ28_05425, partial [Thermoanaerobaculia bacterium]|nr:hypothetical protein [Thermoanaerobaculia bacterium]
MRGGGGRHRYRREAAFEWTINTTGNMSQTDSEMGAMGALGMIAASYLLNVEKECYRALTAIPELSSGKELCRATEIRPVRSRKLRKKRLKTVTAILACSIFYGEIGSPEMEGMLGLLASLAVDGSTGELFEVVTPVVVEAAKHPSSWSLLERVFPGLCRLIEEDDAVSVTPSTEVCASAAAS